MKKAQVIFDITTEKTEVTVIDTKGVFEKLDITNTKMEKVLVRLIKEIHKESQAKEILNALDINTWQEG